VPLDTRERLIQAAWGCVRASGMSGATSRAITTAAEANLGAITYHFGSKEALLGEAVGQAIEALVSPALDALQDETLDPVSRVLNAIARLQQAYEQSAQDAPAYLEVLIQSRRQPPLQERVTRVFAEIRSILATQMTEQQAQGLLPDWVEPDSMAGLLLAVAQGVALETAIDTSGPSHTSMASQFAQLLFASRTNSH
jgi:AcrR family transcriptional regulator